MQSSMASSNPQNVEWMKCHFVCHWGGDMLEEPGGINYRGGEVRVLLANNQMKFSEIMEKIYELTEIDHKCTELKLRMRIPASGSYIAVPLHDDSSLNTLWSCVKQLSKFFIELYLEQVPITAKVSATADTSVLSQVDVKNASINAKKQEATVAPPYAKSLMSTSKILQDELERTGNRIKQHEDNLRFPKTQKTQLDGAILDLQVSLGKLPYASTPKAEDDDSSHVQSEEEIVQQILKYGNSAAAIFYQLKAHHGSQFSNLALSQDVLGVIATLGKVDDNNLSRLFSDYLGLRTMLAIVCKTYECINILETYNNEGLVNKDCGIHGLGVSIGRSLEGRFDVICLDNLRPYAGEILADDPQRRLDIPKPRLPTGEIPAGFLGFAVNMIHIDSSHLPYMTSSGYGLRETLFYNLLSRLQVYRTRTEMLLALPLITDGAVSLDGGMIKASGVFVLGNREDIDVRFPKRAVGSDLPENYYELENQMKQRKWERENILEDMKREQALLDQEKYNFSLRKQDFIKFLADSSSYVVQQQMQMAARDKQGLV